MPILRSVLVLGAAALLAIGAFRVSSASVPNGTLAASRIWPDHSQVLITSALRAVGTAARLGQAVPPRASAQLALAAERDPFAPEPFLVQGALALSKGNYREAEELFEAAKTRDPRSAAARYFLAEQYLRTRRLIAGLNELSVLARLVPGIDQQVVATLAEFAKRDGTLPVLTKFFKGAPQYASNVLALLAQDAGNADIVMALARASNADKAAPLSWHEALVNKLIQAGEPAKAHTVWREFAGIKPYHGLFNPSFQPSSAPAPFNWTYDEGGNGLITPTAGSGLSIIYFGREESDLAEQIVTLSPGNYLLSTVFTGPIPSGSLVWRLDCLPGENALTSASISAIPIGFSVPDNNCSAQRMRLKATPTEAQARVSITIRELRVTKANVK